MASNTIESNKAGLVPFYKNKDGELIVMLMISSDANFGGPKPMISKGGVEAGESLIRAAIREAEEELGLVPTNLIVNTMVFLGKTKHIRPINPIIARKLKISPKTTEIVVLDVYGCQIKDRKNFVTPGFETKRAFWIKASDALTKIRKDHVQFIQRLIVLEG